MPNAILGYDNIISAATLSLSGASVVTGFGLDNLYNRDVNLGLKTNAITTQYVIFDMGATAVQIEGIFIENINLITGDTLIWQGSDDNFATTPDSQSVTIRTHNHNYKSGLTQIGKTKRYQRNFAYFLGQWTRKKYRLQLSKISGTNIEIGEAYLIGSVDTAAINYNAVFTGSPTHSKLNRSGRAGKEISILKYSKMLYTVTWDNMEANQYNALTDVAFSEYVCFFPDGNNFESFYGTVDIPPIQNQGNHGRRRTQMIFMENA